jgi:glycosyltransferase involved in cell wall biosynthesis
MATDVLHLIASLDPRMGGLPRAVAGLAAAQARAGVRVVVGHAGPAPDAALLDAWTQGGVQLPELTFRPLPHAFLPVPSAGLRSELDAMAVEWLQVHGLWEPLLHAGMRWARKRGIPYGISPHSMLHPWHQAHHRLAKTVLRKRVGLEALWAGATRLHALTPVEAAHLEEIPGPPGRIRTIPNGIPPGADPGDSGEPLAGFPDAPFLLFLGRLGDQKNPGVLLEAFAVVARDFPEIHLVIAGPDYGQKRHLLRKAQVEGLEDRVHFPGMLEGRSKWDALHRSLACCIPSRAEGFSLAVLEAALSGTACLISADCGFPELIAAGGGVEIDTRVDPLSAQLRGILNDRAALPEMGERARRLVTGHCTWALAAEQMNRMIKEAL